MPPYTYVFLISCVFWSLSFSTEKSFIAGALLLEEIITSGGLEGIDAVIYSVKRRISESQQAKDTGSPGWWRVSSFILVIC